MLVSPISLKQLQERLVSVYQPMADTVRLFGDLFMQFSQVRAV